MVEIKQLTNYIENTLNTIARSESSIDDIEFKIFTDTGKAVAYSRVDNTITEYINGIFSPSSAQISYLSNGIQVASMSARLSVIVGIDPDEKNGNVLQIELDEDGNPINSTAYQAWMGNEEKLLAVRNLLDSAFRGEQVITSLTDDEGNAYTTTLIAQVAEGGQRSDAGNLGYTFSFHVGFLFTFIENGINTRQGVYKLDGEDIPFTSMTLSRIINQDANVISSNKKHNVENIATFSTLTASFELPALSNNSVTRTIIDSLLGINDRGNAGINSAHVLTISLSREEIAHFLVILSEDSAVASGLQNIGNNVTFHEALPIYDFLSFPEIYNIGTYLGTPTSSLDVTIEGNNPTIVFDASGKLKKVYLSSELLSLTLLFGEKIVTTQKLSSITSLEILRGE